MSSELPQPKSTPDEKVRKKSGTNVVAGSLEAPADSTLAETIVVYEIG